MTFDEVQAENVRLRAENEHLRKQLALCNVDTLADELQRARQDETRALQELFRAQDKVTYWRGEYEALKVQISQKRQGICEQCGAPFETDPHGHKRKRFCSVRCRQASSRETRRIHDFEQRVNTRLSHFQVSKNAFKFH